MTDTFREEYAPLSSEQKGRMANVKTVTEELLSEMDKAVVI